ncbi:MAG: hypothetical protein C7B46_19330 [Sulfobacillus benefaciens]|uniref:Phage Gp37/Gp68 family protein n=1 Tax=Sulfobacillus benefaciens TaxID=453960 RepID=A0A2T2WZG1_9FIRM|nr:MAG: hypothetical protein C7B46_19330 [Sulfobacillus benefaciens]
MSDKTAIGWTDATWNPVTGCSKVSPGCQHCYAEAVSHRYGWTTQPWTMPHAAANVQVHPDRLDQPLRWRKPRRIFVNSMSDLFHEAVPDAFLDQVFAIMAMTDRHTYQILTKRPDRMQQYLTNSETPRRIADVILHTAPSYPIYGVRAVDLYNRSIWPLPNVWLGVSVEDQRRADERIPLLLQTPAAVRFVSCEPLLGPVVLTALPFPVPGGETVAINALHRSSVFAPRIDWVIAGAESGPKARPMDDDWVRSLRDQCQAAGVPFFFKQRATDKGHKLVTPLLDGQLWQAFPDSQISRI